MGKLGMVEGAYRGVHFLKVSRRALVGQDGADLDQRSRCPLVSCI